MTIVTVVVWTMKVMLVVSSLSRRELRRLTVVSLLTLAISTVC